jgi:hypothetical protein
MRNWDRQVMELAKNTASKFSHMGGMLVRFLRGHLFITSSVSALLYSVCLIFPPWTGELRIEFPVLVLPLVPFLASVVIVVVSRRFSPKQGVHSLVTTLLWISGFLLSLAAIAGFYWFFIGALQGIPSYHSSIQGEVLFASMTLDRSIQALLIGSMLGILITALVKEHQLHRDVKPLSVPRSTSNFHQGLSSLLRDSMRYGVLPLIGIYYYVWPQEIVVCEPRGPPEFVESFVGLLFLATIVPSILHYSDPSSSFSQWLRGFFKWPEIPSSFGSLLSMIIGGYAVISKLQGFLSDCMIVSGLGTIPTTILLFLMFSALTIGPAILAILGACIFVELFSESKKPLTFARRLASGILGLLAAVLVIVPLPFYSSVTEFLLMFHYINFPSSASFYRMGAYLFPLLGSVVSVVGLLTYQQPVKLRNLWMIMIVTLVSVSFFKFLSLSFPFLSLGTLPDSNLGLHWLEILTTLNFLALFYALVYTPRRLRCKVSNHIAIEGIAEDQAMK